MKKVISNRNFYPRLNEDKTSISIEDALKRLGFKVKSKESTMGTTRYWYKWSKDIALPLPLTMKNLSTYLMEDFEIKTRLAKDVVWGYPYLIGDRFEINRPEPGDEDYSSLDRIVFILTKFKRGKAGEEAAIGLDV